VRPVVQPLLPRSDLALWHITHQAAKYLPLDSRIPVLLTIHDLNFSHDDAGNVAKPPLSGHHRRKRSAVQRLIDRACAITTDSTYVADHVRAFLDVGDRPLHVFPLGLAGPPQASATRPSFLPPGPFFLSIGNFLPHKHFRVLIRLIEAMPEAWLENVSLCHDARAFQRLQEAMVFFFHSFEAEAMAKVIETGLHSATADAGWSEKARRHASRYSWAKTALTYATLYDSAAQL